MIHLSKIKMLLITLFASLILSSCSISYSFTTKPTIDFSKVKSISIKDFPNTVSAGYAPLSQQFSEALRDKYIRQTKQLTITREGGDLDLEGEITGYDYTSLAVREDAYASQTRLTVTIRVRFTNNANSNDDFDRSFSAYQEFSNENTIDQVQEKLCELIIEEIVDQIFNETVAKW